MVNTATTDEGHNHRGQGHICQVPAPSMSWNILTECPNMCHVLSGAELVSLGDTLLLTGILKPINRFTESFLCSF